MMADQGRANRKNLSVHRQKNAVCACICDDRSQMVGNLLRFVYGALSFVAPTAPRKVLHRQFGFFVDLTEKFLWPRSGNPQALHLSE